MSGVSDLLVFAEIVGKGVFVLLLCGLLALLLRRRSAWAENLVWRSCLVAVVLTSVWSLLPRSVPEANSPPSIFSPVIQVRPRPEPHAIEAEVGAQDAPLGTPNPTPVDWMTLAISTWLLGALLLISRIAIGLVRVRKMVRHSTLLPSLREVTPSDLIVKTSKELSVPVTFGARRAVVLLPEASLQWSEERLKVAIMHESIHIERRDWVWQMASQLLVAVLWFNPACWLLTAALRRSAERAVDDQVIASGVSPATYVQELMSIASTSYPSINVVAMARGDLKGRLRRVLEFDYEKRPRKYAAYVAVSFLAISSCAVARISFRILEALETPFYGPARLSGGQIAKIVSVQRNHKYWAPNGGSSDDKFDVPTSSDDTFEQSLQSDGVVHLSVKGMDNDSIFETDGDGYEIESSSATVDRKSNTDSIFFIKTNPDRQVIDMKIGFGAKPFQLFADETPKHGSLNPILRTNYKKGPISYNGLSVDAFIPPSLRHKQVRLRLILKGSKSQYWNFHLGFVSDHPVDRQGERKVFHFPTLSADKVSRVQLWARDVEWVNFKGIHLQPNP